MNTPFGLLRIARTGASTLIESADTLETAIARVIALYKTYPAEYAIVNRKTGKRILFEEFVHIFLFRCPTCRGPLVSSCFNFESNLEAADQHVFEDVQCECGWHGKLTGFAAIRHWVESWKRLA